MVEWCRWWKRKKGGRIVLKCWGGVVFYMSLWFEGELELNMKRLGSKGGGG